MGAGVPICTPLRPRGGWPAAGAGLVGQRLSLHSGFAVFLGVFFLALQTLLIEWPSVIVGRQGRLVWGG